jgi:hypothetical protein
MKVMADVFASNVSDWKAVFVAVRPSKMWINGNSKGHSFSFDPSIFRDIW